jgi:hypothetical protein
MQRDVSCQNKKYENNCPLLAKLQNYLKGKQKTLVINRRDCSVGCIKDVLHSRQQNHALQLQL